MQNLEKYKNEFLNIYIPFNGFYESIHDQEIEDVLNREVEDGALSESQAEGINYKELYKDYSKEYSQRLSEELGIQWEFKELVSPREYNFGTDKIYVTVSKFQLFKVLANIYKSEGTTPNIEQGIHTHIKEALTERSGFIPFYSNEWGRWGSFLDWDSVQWALVLEAYAHLVYDDIEDEIRDNISETGAILDIIHNNINDN